MQKGKKRQEQTPKKKRIGNNISDIQFVIIKWKKYKEQYKKKGEKD